MGRKPVAEVAKAAPAAETTYSLTDAVQPLTILEVPAAELSVMDDARIVANANERDGDEKMAISIYENGQRQPIECRRSPQTDRLIVVSGHTRRRALLLLAEGFERDGVEYKKSIPAKVIVADDLDPRKAFLAGLATNVHQKSLSPIQEAYAFARLTNEEGEYKWAKQKAAEFFGYNKTNRFSILAEVLELGEFVCELVHDGKLSFNLAHQLKGFDAETRIKFLTHAQDEEGQVNPALLRDFIRAGSTDTSKLYATPDSGEQAGEDDEDEGKKEEGDKKPNIKRSAGDFRKFVERVTADTDDGEADPNLKELLKTFTLYFDGRRNEKTLLNAIWKFKQA